MAHGSAEGIRNLINIIILLLYYLTLVLKILKTIINAEYQVPRRSPHLHTLIYGLLIAQYLLVRTDKHTVIQRIYRQHVHAYLPNMDAEP